MNAVTNIEAAALAASGHSTTERSKYLGGIQSARVAGLNEGLVRHLYGSGMTMAEIAADIGVTERSVRLFMVRCGIDRRVAAKRDQRGEKNATWRGEAVKYKPAHDRVYVARGRPSLCEHFGTTAPDANFEWANVSGQHHDPADYIRLCRSCHCKYDGLIKNLGHHAKEPRHGGRA